MSESAQKTPATAVPAGTIILLRDGDEGMELFMVVRHHQIDFASGALVFPGGKIDPQDEDARIGPRCQGADADPVMRSVQVGSIREAWEEAGVLLARPAGEQALLDGTRVTALDAMRDAVHSGALSFADFLEQEDLYLACDQLVRYAHWVTPPMMPKRFDTHFYVAPAPADHVLSHDGHESVDSVWITPAQVLADAASGARTVIFPTLRNIEKLGRFPSLEHTLETARSESIVTVLPWTEKREDGTWLCIPPEAGYLVSEEKMPER